MNLNIIQINNGGKGHNPFEYYYSNGAEQETNEWDYKAIMYGLSRDDLLSYLEIMDTEKYQLFVDYIKTIDDGPIFDHFFSKGIDHCEEVLMLENKFGRTESDFKRFNPVEFGYDTLYFEENEINQYFYVKKCGVDKSDISSLLHKCLDVPHLNPKFNLTDTSWLTQTFAVERVYDIILYDMLKTFSVYEHYLEYDKIYVSVQDDCRLERIIEKLGNSPAIFVTQEGGFDDERLTLLHEVNIEDGVKLYSYNIDVSVYRINSISSSITDMLGTKKGMDIELLVNNKIIRLMGLHCKEPKKERTYEKFVSYGLLGFTNFSFSNLIRSSMDHVYHTYYGIMDKITIMVGDMNPKDTEKSLYIKDLIESQSNFKVYPEKNEVTSQKTRSGFCAQLKKFWTLSKSCKDMIIVENTLEVNSYEVFPEIKELLTSKWVGDHASLIMNITV